MKVESQTKLDIRIKSWRMCSHTVTEVKKLTLELISFKSK